jgi:hypothetical protein
MLLSMLHSSIPVCRLKCLICLTSVSVTNDYKLITWASQQQTRPWDSRVVRATCSGGDRDGAGGHSLASGQAYQTWKGYGELRGFRAFSIACLRLAEPAWPCSQRVVSTWSCWLREGTMRTCHSAWLARVEVLRSAAR